MYLYFVYKCWLFGKDFNKNNIGGNKPSYFTAMKWHRVLDYRIDIMRSPWLRTWLFNGRDGSINSIQFKLR